MIGAYTEMQLYFDDVHNKYHPNDKGTTIKR